MTDNESISVEHRCRVYNDSHGYYAEVKPDSDGLGLCEIGYSDGDRGATLRSFCISWEMAEALSKAILKISSLNKAIAR